MRARSAAAFAALVALACVSCRAPGPVAPVEPAAGPGRVAVLPFRVQGFLDPAGRFVRLHDAGEMSEDLGTYIAERLTSGLDALGESTVPADTVLRATPVAGAALYEPRLAARIAREVGAEFAVMGAVRRFVQRRGSALSVESPASVEYQAMAVAAASGAVIGTYLFDYTQKPLAEDLTTLPDFLQGGGKWRTREDVLDHSLPKMAKKIASALRGRRGSR